MKQKQNSYLFYFVLFLIIFQATTNAVSRRYSKRLQEKKSQIKQGIVIMDSFIRALELKNNSKVFRKLYSGTCIKNVITPNKFKKVIKTYRRKFNVRLLRKVILGKKKSEMLRKREKRARRFRREREERIARKERRERKERRARKARSKSGLENLEEL